MRIIGIDPGSRYTGYGIVEKKPTSMTHIASGRILASKGATLANRLEIIYDGLTQVLGEFECSCAAVESVFTQRNPRSSLILGHARGVALLALAHAGVSVEEYAPATVKKAVAGHGRATKEAIGLMVGQSLGVDPSNLSEDAADALAVALCHGGAVEYLERLSEPGKAP